MDTLVQYSRHDTVGIVTVDNPPVNALSVGVRTGMVECLQEAIADPEAKAIVLVCAGRTFIAGADITEFGKPLEDPGLDVVIQRLEDSPKPVIAAVHGTALGGGLEVTLGCHYRCGVSSAKFGLPEVKLGIVPGAGGTQRLPRLIGIEAALKIITSGEPIGAERALELGLIDEVLTGDLVDGAVKFAERVVAEGRPLRKVRDLTKQTTEGSAALFDAARTDLAKRKRGFEAPQRCVDCVEAACTLPFDEGLAKEREIFAACLASEQSAAQRHFFFAERTVAKIPDVPKETPVHPIERAGIVGAGTMGGGIAMNFANAGIPVTVLEVSQDALDRGLETVRKNYAATVKKGRLSQEAMDTRMGLISPTLSYDAFSNVDIVIEAVFEEMDLKKQVFGTLDKVCGPEAIMATNTSTLDVNEIAAATSRPGQVIGLHFFSPANVMRLLEIVRADKTSKETIATAMALAKTIKKVGVLVGVCDGFVGNRMLAGYLREATFLLEEGALPHGVDKVIYDFGLPMGPFAMSDLAGLDVGWRIRKRQAAARPKDERYSAIGDKLCEQGRFGQKTGAGFYRYEAGSRTPIPDPEVSALILKESETLGIKRRTISEDEVLTRCIYPLINEGARILEEGIALRSSDIDVIYVYGYGFPVYRGGPMFYADTVGLKQVYQTVCEYQQVHGKLWEPAPLLKRLAEENRTFSDQ